MAAKCICGCRGSWCIGQPRGLGHRRISWLDLERHKQCMALAAVQPTKFGLEVGSPATTGYSIQCSMHCICTVECMHSVSASHNQLQASQHLKLPDICHGAAPIGGKCSRSPAKPMLVPVQQVTQRSSATLGELPDTQACYALSAACALSRKFRKQRMDGGHKPCPLHEPLLCCTSCRRLGPRPLL